MSGGGETTVARREPLAPGTGVLLEVDDEPMGVLARETGVFARVTGVLCCLEVLPFGGGRRIPAGEFDRDETGLGEFEAVPNFFIRTGRREEAEECGDGDSSTCRRA